MIQKILEGMSSKINSAYPNCDIAVDDVQQNFNEPCFVVSLVSGNIDKFRSNKCSLECMFDIKYYPKTEDQTSQCNEVAWRLYELMEYISIETNLVRGIKMQHNITDNVMHFLVIYKMNLLKSTYKEIMGELKLQLELKKKGDK